MKKKQLRKLLKKIAEDIQMDADMIVHNRYDLVENREGMAADWDHYAEVIRKALKK